MALHLVTAADDQARSDSFEGVRESLLPTPGRSQGDGRFDAPPDWEERSQEHAPGLSAPPPLALTTQDSVPRQTARASATQLSRERDPHEAPKLGIPPGVVSPAMCRRSSGHAILCSQGKWGRGGQPRPLFPGFLSAQSGGASNLPSPCRKRRAGGGTSGFWK